MCYDFFFFFKQKTAYEMRISDWSSDVCSSDLLQAAEDIELERQQLHEQWKLRLERAGYETALVRRRYEAVDPDNRLVARTLERDWECALSAEQALRDEQQRALAEEPEHLTD